MIFKLNNCILDIDVERTRAFYERTDIKSIGEQCSCCGCQNYDKVIMEASDRVTEFLRSLGIDPRKPPEVYNVTGLLEEEGTIWYNGWYHVCGRIVESPDMVEETLLDTGVILKRTCWEHSYSPDPDFPFMVLPILDQALLHEDFPTPVIQLEIDTHLPYVLGTPYEG